MACHLFSVQCQAINWTNAGMLLIGPVETDFEKWNYYQNKISEPMLVVCFSDTYSETCL